MSHCRSLPSTVTNRHVKLSIDTFCDQQVREIVDRYLPLVWPIGLWNCLSTSIALTSRYKALYNSLLSTPVGLSTSWCLDYRYLLSPVIGRWHCGWIPISLPNRSRGIGIIDTLEKKGVRGVSVEHGSSYRLKSSQTYLLKFLPGITVNLLFRNKGQEVGQGTYCYHPSYSFNNSLGYTV